ncbi:MAG: hypothetical protein NTZ51_04545 [Proteobacteria bacterium]|nr:hypothetical protein [Pseudomonadota bacterium]
MDKKQIVCIAVSLSFLLCLGCITGGKATQNIAPSPTPNVQFIPEYNPVKITGIKRVAIFPFADYSHQQDKMGIDAWGGNIKIVEEVTDHFVAHGVSVIVQEDVNTLLADYNVRRKITINRLALLNMKLPITNTALSWLKN